MNRTLFKVDCIQYKANCFIFFFGVLGSIKPNTKKAILNYLRIARVGKLRNGSINQSSDLLYVFLGTLTHQK